MQARFGLLAYALDFGLEGPCRRFVRSAACFLRRGIPGLFGVALRLFLRAPRAFGLFADLFEFVLEFGVGLGACACDLGFECPRGRFLRRAAGFFRRRLTQRLRFDRTLLLRFGGFDAQTFEFLCRLFSVSALTRATSASRARAADSSAARFASFADLLAPLRPHAATASCACRSRRRPCGFVRVPL